MQRLSKGKKGLKKKVQDPFARKDWYDIKAPSMFEVRNVGKTCVNRSQGLKNADDSLRGRLLEISLGDLNKDEAQAFRKIELKIEQVAGKTCLANFHGLSFTTDKLRSMIKKWQSLIEASVDVKTTDGYLLRFFIIGFTKRRPNQLRKTTYAQSSQIRAIRKKMVEITTREMSTVDLKGAVEKMIPEVIGKEVEKSTQGIFPLANVFVRKVKVLKAPKFDMAKLLELHGEGSVAAAAATDAGSKVERPAEFKEQVFTSV
eukprot:Partr_v1_DN22917_c0_g1_i1_m42523 putative 40s ribosomal protein